MNTNNLSGIIEEVHKFISENKSPFQTEVIYSSSFEVAKITSQLMISYILLLMVIVLEMALLKFHILLFISSVEPEIKKPIKNIFIKQKQNNSHRPGADVTISVLNCLRIQNLFTLLYIKIKSTVAYFLFSGATTRDEEKKEEGTVTINLNIGTNPAAVSTENLKINVQQAAEQEELRSKPKAKFKRKNIILG